ncbi:26105_t:CDS:10 [Dentiscutata erythropus]|uniref:26105_t:CDS:1 n=1 Tax=Dentiscutata erythropus TaxID=1348616 RepID=A0A9N8Z945_9GLOM|nr:26105_t:CDS:10 [Dentiscutata erythropus]
MATRNKRITDVELDEIMLKKTCQTIVHSADLELVEEFPLTITIKQVRRDAEVKLGLTAKFLDKQPWKDLIHEFVTEAIQKSKSEDESVAYSSRPKSRRAGKKSSAIQSKKILNQCLKKIGKIWFLKSVQLTANLRGIEFRMEEKGLNFMQFNDNETSDNRARKIETIKKDDKTIYLEDSKDDNIVEDGGSVMALENKVAQESDQGLNKSRTKEFRNDKLANSSMEEDSENDISSESKRSNDAEISDTEHEIEKSATTKRASFNNGDSHSEPEGDPPKKRKTKKGKSAPTVSSNNDDDEATIKELKAEATIKELKAFIVKCGVRKVWSRELADCDSISSQINRLNKILSDLGIKGRPTLEKCKKIRERRELEAELNSMDVGNIISDDIKEGRKARASRGIFNPTGRRIIRAKRQIEEETDDGASTEPNQDSE